MFMSANDQKGKVCLLLVGSLVETCVNNHSAKMAFGLLPKRIEANKLV